MKQQCTRSARKHNFKCTQILKFPRPVNCFYDLLSMSINFISPNVFFYHPIVRLLDWLMPTGRYFSTQINKINKKTKAEISFLFLPTPIQKPHSKKSSVQTDIFPQNLTFEILISYCYLLRYPNIILHSTKLHTNFGGTQPGKNAEDFSEKSVAGCDDIQFHFNFIISISCQFSIIFANLYLFSFFIQSKDIAYKLQFVHYRSFYPRFQFREMSRILKKGS